MKIRLTITILLTGALVGQLLPMTLMPEPNDPWYIGITTVWFLLSAFLYYPATALALLMRQPVHGVAHWTLNLAWLVVLCFLVWGSRRWRRGRSGAGRHVPRAPLADRPSDD